MLKNIYNFLRQRPYRTALPVLYDAVAAIISMYAALYFTGTWPLTAGKDYIVLFVSTVLMTWLSFFFCRMYSILYSKAGLYEGIHSFIAVFLVFSLEMLAYFPKRGVFTLLFGFPSEKIGVVQCYLFATVLLLFTLVFRFSLRILGFLSDGISGHRRNRVRVMLIGAGEAATALVREMQHSAYVSLVPVCILDDDKAKIGMRLWGVPVVDTIDNVEKAAARYRIEQIFLAIPSASNKRRKEMIALCQKTDCKIMVLPGIYQLINEDVSISKLRKVEITDLLGREEIVVNSDEIMGYIEGKCILVTGGGGSIGSELCRQIAAHNPSRLIILDIYENNAYDIEQELRRNLPSLNLLTLIASVRDRNKIETVFRTYRPAIVFNAAAHKHVPLMETSPNEAVKNNVFGTLNVAEMADKYGAERFVQISTDKAVNPTNIMGATKRICEMIVQTIGHHSKTKFVAVRFGNVLGSNGSVIPLFRRQIEAGGPVTVTHKDIVRYFMTIPEAVSLVLQAGAYAEGGQIFVLDMGEQVRIYDLACNLIRLSGYTPNVDIEVKITGLRPGEKLYEERLMAEEGLRTTANKSISIGAPLDIDESFLHQKLEELYHAAYAESDHMKNLVAELVTTYHPQV